MQFRWIEVQVVDQPVLRLLHIEDNPADAVLLADILEMEEGGQRFDLVWEELLERGLTRLAGETFHALLLDLNLPDGQGIVRSGAPARWRRMFPSW